MKKSLIENVMAVMATGEIPEGAMQDTMPENPNHNITEVRLGGNKEIWAEVRRKLVELENELLADARERLRVLTEEERAEMKVYKEGDRDIQAMMADGMSREQIIEARSTASVALEMAHLKQKEIDDCEDEIDRIKRGWITKRDRVNRTLQGVEIGTRSWLLDLVSGSNSNRLNPDRPVRMYGSLLHAEKFCSEVLGEELGARAVRAMGTFTCPDNVWDTVWSLTTDRSKKEKFDEADSPEKVLARLDNAITGDAK